MRKNSFILIFILFNSLFCYAQQDVIVLVDVSKSIKQSHFLEAREVVREILQGSEIGNNNFKVRLDPKSSLRLGKGNPLLKSGKKLLILPFGERNFWNETYSFHKINGFSSYFENNYPKKVSDNKTYLKLARIKAAETAKKSGINNYILILVSDNISDDYGKGGKPNYTSHQQNAESNFKTVSNPYVEKGQGEITYKYDRNYKITLHTVNIKDWNYTPTNKTPGGTNTGSGVNTKCELKFTSFANGKKGKEKTVKSNAVTFRWSAKNKPEGAKYKISISSTTGNRANNNSKSSLTSNSYSVNLEDDTYRVSITSAGCKSDVTYIKVASSSGGGGFFLFLFILAIVVGLGYYLYKRNQVKKMEETQFGDSSIETDVNYDGTDSNSELDGF